MPNQGMSSLNKTVTAKIERIRDNLNTIPPKNIANYIINGDITMSWVEQRLQDVGRPEKVTQVREILKSRDDEIWKSDSEKGSLSDLRHYKNVFPRGNHILECNKMLDQMDDERWNNVRSNLTEDSLRDYKITFSNGKHINECNDLLEDHPWLRLTSKRPYPTIEDYEQYMSTYPGQHVEEIQYAIKEIEERKDWNDAATRNNTDAYKLYLRNHPNGKYKSEAEKRIREMKVIDELRKNKNVYPPQRLRELIARNAIRMSDLEEVYTDEEIEAINEYDEPTELPSGDPPNKLTSGNTEVYFWGTPQSGKTCALGAVLSAADKEGIISRRDCPGLDYMNRLSNIFESRRICTLPKGTDDGTIQEMIFSLRDNKNKEHYIALIDLAGEAFRTIYYKVTDNLDYASEDAIASLEKIERYLNDKTNKKIHFFVVEYGGENKEWHGLSMKNYLETAMIYLNDRGVIKKGTNGVYILVTKSDNMPCSKEEREDFALNYIRETMPAFYNNLVKICKNAGIGGFQVIPFSIGDVFAQKLCHFEKENAKEVIEEIIFKSEKKSTGFCGFLKN